MVRVFEVEWIRGRVVRNDIEEVSSGERLWRVCFIDYDEEYGFEFYISRNFYRI